MLVRKIGNAVATGKVLCWVLKASDFYKMPRP